MKSAAISPHCRVVEKASVQSTVARGTRSKSRAASSLLPGARWERFDSHAETPAADEKQQRERTLTVRLPSRGGGSELIS